MFIPQNDKFLWNTLVLQNMNHLFPFLYFAKCFGKMKKQAFGKL